MNISRKNHYVPQWYQEGFADGKNELHYLDMCPDKKTLPDGRLITLNDYYTWPFSKCFVEQDLYTIFFGHYINDEIERKLFGIIDDGGARAVKAFIGDDVAEWHKYFFDFFSYIDAQKIRTPKGLNWIKNHYSDLDQTKLMIEMQALRGVHCTTWVGGVREIVSAKESGIKFIISDHPVTIYNHACPPDSNLCNYPNDPAIALKGTQTIFPLDAEHCLILTNYEYAKNPDKENPLEKRTNARNFSNELTRTDAFIKVRSLKDDEVEKINFIIKSRAKRYIAASKKEWLYPEKNVKSDWSELRKVLLPPENHLWKYGGEIYVSYNDGRVDYQDAFGRSTPENEYLKKSKKEGKVGANKPCACGSGKKFKHCCKNKKPSERPSNSVLSIRERNIVFYRGISDILGLVNGKSWDDVRRDVSDEQIKRIYELYSVLWPKETDLISLLPKPDKNLRALYTGIIDPRVISIFAPSSVLYFDEVIIQSPFINPVNIRPEYNPINVPAQYKQQTIQDIILLIQLMPFIEAGYINFIPDLCSFNPHLQQQMFNFAESRRGKISLSEREKALFDELRKDDFERVIRTLPLDQAIGHIRKANPDIKESEIEEMLNYFEERNVKDPFTILRGGVYDKGQSYLMSMTPNFEMSLFICQATGSILLTGSDYRWEEIIISQYKSNGITNYSWKEISDHVDKFDYLLSGNYEFALKLRRLGKLGRLRRSLKDVYSTIHEVVDKSKVEALKTQYSESYNIFLRELKSENDRYSIVGNFRCLIPDGGIVSNNIQRMLVSCGVDNYSKNVPMAIFMEPKQN